MNLILNTQATQRRTADGRIVITVPGPPLGKPRQTQSDKWNKRPAVMRYRCWSDLARLCAGRLPDPADVARLDWVAYFTPPASWSKAKRAEAIGQIHRAKPDRDNIDKAVLDSLFKEDSGIGVGSIAKYWAAEARLEIVIALNPKATP